MLSMLGRMSSTAAAEKSDNFTQQLTDKFFDSAATGNLEAIKSLLSGKFLCLLKLFLIF